MNIVIIGFGVAGATAAETARKMNPGAYITLFGQESDLFYYRTRLPEIVSGALPIEKVVAHPKSWYQERRIELRVGERVVEVEPQSRLVRSSLGSRLIYDRLLLATGAESNRPKFPGDDLPGLFAVRSLKDAWELNMYAKGKKNAVLIGGGILGLEMAASLTKLGLAVKVLEQSGRILPRQTTPKSAAKLQKMLAAMGIEFVLNAQAKSFGGKSAIEEVALASGETLPADLVLMSVGIRPNLDLAKALNLKIDRAIVVDEFLETSHPEIYAAGDCAQAANCVGGLWTTSYQQGLRAGENLVAERSERKAFAPEAPSNTLKVAGIDLVATGDLDPDGARPSVEAENENAYRKVTLNAEGAIVGFTNLGTTAGNRELTAALAGKKKLAPETVKALADLNFDFKTL